MFLVFSSNITLYILCSWYSQVIWHCTLYVRGILWSSGSVRDLEKIQLCFETTYIYVYTYVTFCRVNIAEVKHVSYLWTSTILHVIIIFGFIIIFSAFVLFVQSNFIDWILFDFLLHTITGRNIVILVSLTRCTCRAEVDFSLTENINKSWSKDKCKILLFNSNIAAHEFLWFLCWKSKIWMLCLKI